MFFVFTLVSAAGEDPLVRKQVVVGIFSSQFPGFGSDQLSDFRDVFRLIPNAPHFFLVFSPPQFFWFLDWFPRKRPRPKHVAAAEKWAGGGNFKGRLHFKHRASFAAGD